jgi:hypothetical protein
MAAVLACGPGAVLSYRSAAAHLGIRPTDRRLIEVTSGRGRRASAGIELHCDRLAADEVAVVRGIPVTTSTRTLFDLAAVLDRHRLERALNQAEILRILDTQELARLIDLHPRRRGTRALRTILAASLSGPTRGELEELFLPFVHSYSLPLPELNVDIRIGDTWIEADCLWRAQRVIVELDGHGVHGTRASFESDRKRDRALQAQGWRTVRVTWRHLEEDAEALAADLHKLLS